MPFPANMATERYLIHFTPRVLGSEIKRDLIPHFSHFNTNYFIISKVYTDVAGIKYTHSLYVCMGDIPHADYLLVQTMV